MGAWADRDWRRTSSRPLWMRARAARSRSDLSRQQPCGARPYAVALQEGIADMDDREIPGQAADRPARGRRSAQPIACEARSSRVRVVPETCGCRQPSGPARRSRPAAPGKPASRRAIAGSPVPRREPGHERSSPERPSFRLAATLRGDGRRTHRPRLRPPRTNRQAGAVSSDRCRRIVVEATRAPVPEPWRKMTKTGWVGTIAPSGRPKRASVRRRQGAREASSTRASSSARIS